MERNTLQIQQKALIQMLRLGELDAHTVTLKVKPRKDNPDGIEEITIMKVNNIYRCPEHLKQQHREYLLRKYNGVIPYNYDGKDEEEEE